MAPEIPKPRVYAASQLRVGLSDEFERDVSESDVLDFARISGDFNPLHVDAAYAQGSNYGARIVHGAFQVGLASAFIGMVLPGLSVLLGSVNARFPAPLFYPCRVVVRGEIVAWNASQQSGSLKVIVLEAVRRTPVAEISMGFTLHEQRESSPALLPDAAPRATARFSDARRPTVLVTGAAGGLGAALIEALAHDYFVLAMVNRQPLTPALAENVNIRAVSADFNAPDWHETLHAALPTPDEGGLYGIVHGAWPGMPQGSLLDTSDDVLQSQMAFGTTHLVRLARLLFAQVGQGGRLIALGSTAGTSRPLLSRGAYSLGKAALENTVRLLAPELARRQITVNAICPSFVPVGMNRQSNERQRKIEASQVPLGRLCEPDDVAGMIGYLLSPQASFVSGQILELTGGKL